MVAAQHGARDWNTLHARLSVPEPALPWRLGQSVRGRYLGQAFAGQLTGLSQRGTLIAVTIRLDRPIDTVRFESFSNLRRRLHGVVGAEGVSPRRTSDGQPQLVLER